MADPANQPRDRSDAGVPSRDSGIAVILPNYNHGRFLSRAVEAILAQDTPPSDIIIIDDGSTDDSLAIIEQLATRSPIIRVLQNPLNRGLIATQRRALKIATARFIYLAAADDIVRPGFFSKALRMFEIYPTAGLFVGDAELVDGVNNASLGLRPIVMPRFSPGYIEPSRIRQMLRYNDNWILTGAALMRRDAIEMAGGLDEDLESFADGFVTRKISLTHGICYAPGIIVTCNIFPTGVSRHIALHFDSAIRFLEKSRRRISSDPVFPPEYAVLFGNRWRFATSRLALQRQPADRQILMGLGARNRWDRRIIELILTLSKGTLGQTAILLYLALRLRPYSFLSIIRTAIARRFMQRS